MVADRIELWDRYHKMQEKQKESNISKEGWITDSGLSFTEKLLSAGHEIKKKKGEECKSPEHYIKKMFSTADNLCEEAEKKGGTEEASKDIIKKYISKEKIPYEGDTYNLLDIVDNSEGNCLGKSSLFAGLSELIDYDLFSRLKLIYIPRHVFIRVKGNPDKKIETTAKYQRIERESVGEGMEYDINAVFPDFFYSSYVEEGDETDVDNILEKWPEHEKALFEKGRYLLERKNISEAEQYADKVLAGTKDDPESFLLKGDLEYEKGNKLKAVEYYKKINSSPYANKEDRKLASERILRMERELSNKEEAEYYEASLLRFDGKNDEALSILKNLKLSSEKDWKYNAMGIIYGQKGDCEKALECVEKAIEINPNHPAHYYNKGIYLKAQGDGELARKCYEKALEVDSEYIPAKKKLLN